MPRKKNKKIYFGMDVQDAIIRYNQSEDEVERNKIYRDEIHTAFDKLAENIINTFKFTYFDCPFDDIKHEVVAFLILNIHKYNPDKGSKAFSYFSVVAKNYLILHNNNNYKKLKKHDSIDDLDDSIFTDSSNRKQYLKDFLEEFKIYLDEQIPYIFKKEKDRKIAYSIVHLIDNKNMLENFNKKCLYLLIREMTNVKTVDITKVTNILKKYYKKAFNNYESQGYVVAEKERYFF